MRTTTAAALLTVTTLGLFWIGCAQPVETEGKGETTSNIDATERKAAGTNLSTVRPAAVAPPAAIDIQPANGTTVSRDRASSVSFHFTGFTLAAGQTVEIQVLSTAGAAIAEGNWTTIATGTSSTTATTFNDAAPIFRYDVQATPGANRRWKEGGVVRYRTVVTDAAGAKSLLPFFDTASGTCIADTGASKSWKELVAKCKSPFSPDFGAALGSTNKAAALVSTTVGPEDVSRPDFLSRQGFISERETDDYLDIIDAPRTLNQFRRRFGFDTQNEVDADYYNLGDLGIGREMHCTTFSGGKNGQGGVACYVRNYGVRNNIGDFSGDADAAMRDLVRGDGSFAAVCMVKFGNAFADPNGNDVQFMVYDANEDLVNRAQLDVEDSNESIPTNCINCHGGKYDRQRGVIMGSSFLPFDPEAFLFTDRGGRDYASQEDQIRALNALMAQAGPPPSTKQYVDGTYGGKADVAGTKANIDWIPAGWSTSEEAKTVYREVYKPYCRTCHTSQIGDYAFVTYEDFKNEAAKSMHSVCGTNEMPLAEATMNNFWESGARAYLFNALGTNASCAPGGDE